MQELILVKNVDGEPLASSRTIAHVFKKEHKDVLKAIRNHEISEEFRERNFTLSSYKTAQNKKKPKYLMTRDGYSMIIMSFTGKKAVEWKEKFIMAFNAMEKALLLTRRLPKTFAESLRMLADEVDKNQLLESKIESDKPLVEFASQIKESNDSISIGEFAKILSKNGYEIGQNNLFKKLRELKLIFLSNRKNVPYQNAIKSGWLKLDEFSTEIVKNETNELINKLCTKITVTGKGQVYISKRLGIKG
ncbi:phage regulatory protein/antirepressor Ant [bacterium]|nr:phage regulatory protein/antirepressor Ant [bacterium]